LPLVTGVSYEVVRLAGRRNPPKIVELAIAPGLWLQRLTTREPDDAQLEVAIAALKDVLEVDGV
jgi:Predicted metal-dependent enzyme